jgi:uncharacterized membrane protein YgaE (UPF0421/DUF939 family)
VPVRLPGPLRWLGPIALQAGKTALAAGFSWFLAANVLGNKVPVFAPLAALLTVQVTVWESVSRGFQRVLGVVVGVLVAYTFARLAGINAWSIALIVFASLLTGRALRLGQQGSIQVPVSALLVLVLGATTGGYAIDRVVDTAIGAGVGIVVNLVIVPRTHLPEAQAELRSSTRALATLLRDIASSLLRSEGVMSAHLERARHLSVETTRAALAVQGTETATRWNPAARRDRPAVERLQGAVSALAMVERPVRGIARVLADAPDGWHVPPEIGRLLGDLLEKVAGELESWAARATGAPAGQDPSGPVGLSVAALYRAVLVAARAPEISPETAAIVSAIALDARRIDDELQGEPEALPPPPLSWHSLFGP